MYSVFLYDCDVLRYVPLKDPKIPTYSAIFVIWELNDNKLRIDVFIVSTTDPKTDHLGNIWGSFGSIWNVIYSNSAISRNDKQTMGNNRTIFSITS